MSNNSLLKLTTVIVQGGVKNLEIYNTRVKSSTLFVARIDRNTLHLYGLEGSAITQSVWINNIQVRRYIPGSMMSMDANKNIYENGINRRLFCQPTKLLWLGDNYNSQILLWKLRVKDTCCITKIDSDARERARPLNVIAIGYSKVSQIPTVYQLQIELRDNAVMDGSKKTRRIRYNMCINNLQASMYGKSTLRGFAVKNQIAIQGHGNGKNCVRLVALGMCNVFLKEQRTNTTHTRMGFSGEIVLSDMVVTRTNTSNTVFNTAITTAINYQNQNQNQNQQQELNQILNNSMYEVRQVEDYTHGFPKPDKKEMVRDMLIDATGEIKDGERPIFIISGNLKVEDVESNVNSCRICLSNLAIATLNCGHELCKSCTYTHRKQENPVCPVCRKKIIIAIISYRGERRKST